MKMNRRKGLKRIGIRRVSKKLSGQKKTYMALREKYLEYHPWCEVELNEAGIAHLTGVNLIPMATALRIQTATEIHHKMGRGKYLNDTSTWMAVCQRSHRRIHDDPAWAKAKGYLTPRVDSSFLRNGSTTHYLR